MGLEWPPDLENPPDESCRASEAPGAGPKAQNPSKTARTPKISQWFPGHLEIAQQIDLPDHPNGSPSLQERAQEHAPETKTHRR